MPALLRTLLLYTAVAVVATFAAEVLAADAGCRAASGPRAPAVVELYTSEGCSSCPPADAWLSGLKGRPDVVPLAFHVDYWDSLGWKDRFAQAQFSKRQVASQRTSGAKFPYTPQVIVDGRDTPRWSALAAASLGGGAPASTAAPLALALERQGEALQLTVAPQPGAKLPSTVAGYVAVVDDGLQTRVGAGENKGATLKQDAVVRELLPWSAPGTGAQTLRLSPTAPAEAGATRHWVAVATDAETGRPLQAVSLACAR